ncbi:putative casein kinase II subunit beta-4, partial [Mucuna pruriens]
MNDYKGKEGESVVGRKRIKEKQQQQQQPCPSNTPHRRSASLPNTQHEESETDIEGSDVSGSEEDDTSWISWFCNLRGNEFFCEVDDDYVQDDFNLCGLSSQVPYYDYALDLILDVESSHGDIFTEEQNEMIESAAEMLYGLIHARFILTSKGMAAMLHKYKNYDFGRCPRVYCSGQPCLPVGQSDIPRASTVKIYCPRCDDIYYPKSKYQDIDGAYFGATFPHLFLMTYGNLKSQKPSQNYVPRNVLTLDEEEEDISCIVKQKSKYFLFFLSRPTPQALVNCVLGQILQT